MLQGCEVEQVAWCSLFFFTSSQPDKNLCVCVCRKLWLLKAESGDVVHGWPVNIARQLNTAPLVTRLYPLDLTLFVSTVRK